MYGDLFRVENVIFVTGLHDTTTKRKEIPEREAKKESQSFADVLKKACDGVETERRDISYNVSGYTKQGLSYDYLEMRREYVRKP